MTSELIFCNRQRDCHVDLSLLRRITRWLLTEGVKVDEFALGVHLVSAAEITRLNEAYLQHHGSTDVITFDYAEPAGRAPRLTRPRGVPTPTEPHQAGGAGALCGEIFICPAQAARQARQFRTNWQAEIVRYATHGVLHLLGYDDLRPTARRSMKRAEDQLLRELSRRFPIRKLAKVLPVRGPSAIGHRQSAIQSPLCLEPLKART